MNVNSTPPPVRRFEVHYTKLVITKLVILRPPMSFVTESPFSKRNVPHPKDQV
jgi:hypothetical protein